MYRSTGNTVRELREVTKRKRAGINMSENGATREQRTCEQGNAMWCRQVEEK